MSKPNERGFSLLELLIVVAIILIIATIAIPSLLRSRQAANESAAVANLRAISTAQITFAASRGNSYGNATSLVTEGLLDNRFGSTAIAGYTFAITSGFTTFTAAASPVGNSGRFTYVVYEDGIIRYGTSFPTGQAAGGVVQ